MCAHQVLGTDEQFAPVRKIHSLRQVDVEKAVGKLQQLSTGWEIDQHDDCDGDVMLIITPPETTASTGIFIISRDLNGIQLATTEQDLYETVGQFETVTAAIQSLFR